MTLEGAIAWVVNNRLPMGILALLVVAIVVYFVIYVRKMKSEIAVYDDESAKIVSTRTALESLSDFSDAEQAQDAIGRILRMHAGGRVQDVANKYVTILKASGKIYDPELLIRQEFKQLVQDRLLSRGEDLIRLGLVGTFLGLVIGLICLDTTDSSSLFASVSKMLASMGLAFVSSLFGLLFAMWYRRFCSQYEDRYEHWEDELSGLLSQSIGMHLVSGPDVRLSRAADTLSASTARLPGLIENMGTSSAQMAACSRALETSIGDLNMAAKNLTEGSFEELTRISGRVEESAASISSELPKIVEASRDGTSKILEVLDVFHGMTLELQGAVGLISGTGIYKQLDSLCDAVQGLVSRLEAESESEAEQA